MRNPLLRNPRPGKPKLTLKERAAALKASFVRLTHRGPAEHHGGAEPSRRAVMAGSIAAAIPFSAVAGHADALAGPHPDQAVFDAEAEMIRAKAAYEAARAAHDPAREAFKAALGTCPEALFLNYDDEGALALVGGRHAFYSSERRWVSDHRGCGLGMSQAWTADGLRTAIQHAPAIHGRAGRTPHMIRRWRTLLPIAEAFDARHDELEARYRIKELSAAVRDTHRAMISAQEAMSATRATTPAGLAAITRHLGDFCWEGMGSAWIGLLQSAANVSGVKLREPYEPRGDA